MADPDDHLYGLPLEEFTPARDAAARELRKAGDRDTAARVAKLPKPSPAAWTANQVAREQPELIEALLDAGAALRAAQDAAVSGHGGRGLREATLAERGAVDAVMNAATAHKPAGRPLSRQMADRLRTTLHAVAADPALRDALTSGRLVSEAQSGGAWPFALEPGEPPPLEKPAKRAPKRKPDTDEQAEREAAEQAAREREQRKQLEAQLRDARMSLRVRERVAGGAADDAEAAAQAVADADERLEEAKQAAEEARAEADAAQRVFAEAQSELERARDDVARLEERLD